MLIDIDGLFAQNVSLVDSDNKAVELGEKGLGYGSGIKFFVEVSEDFSGVSSVSWKLSMADDEAGAVNKEDLLISPEYSVDRLKKGFCFMLELPATDRKYLLLETVKDGVASAGRYWSGLTSSEQYAAHNR